MSSFADLKKRREARKPAALTFNGTTEEAGPPADVAGAAPIEDPSAPHALSIPHALEENPDIEVRWTSKHGRGLYWQPKDGRVCKRGTNLLRLRPHATVPSEECLRYVCSACLKILKLANATDAMRCSRCRMMRYCDTECQRADWPDHKLECTALQEYTKRRRMAEEQARKDAEDHPEEENAERFAMAVGKDTPMEAVAKTHDRNTDDAKDPGAAIRILARLVWSKSRISKQAWRQVKDQFSPRQLMSLEQLQEAGKLAARFAFFLGCASGIEDRQPSNSRALVSHESLPSDLTGYGFANAQDVLDFVCKYTSNAFTAARGDLDPCGISICPTAALLNSSCIPNAVVVFPWGPNANLPASQSQDRMRCLHINVIKDLNPGDEILTSYLDLSEPLHRREETLMRSYSFKCDCAMCKKCRKTEKAQIKAMRDGSTLDLEGLWQDPRDAALCQIKDCKGWVALPRPDPKESIAGILRIICQACRKMQTIDLEPLQKLRLSGAEQWMAAERAFAQHNPGSTLAMLTLLPTLRRHLPPAAFPLFPMLRLLHLAAIEKANSVEVRASQSKALQQQSASYDTAIYAGMLQIQGMQVGNGSIFADGHPAKALAFAAVGRLVMNEAALRPQERNLTPPKNLAQYFGTVPSLPGLPRTCLEAAQFARANLRQASTQIKIGFADRGTSLAAVTEALDDLERGIMASAMQP
ncbi:hypothetical protein K437DRAFT_37565 [Tilletiaria anomala UBC 951]|uniref:SET domain-containing protein n=1 Tax=Tilletiaria anomala (strain ATCC 24038 / CBS 436.72 / UBC 951) TaxID=1037660 RepID=A0A066VB97_TILAU|nr:uncharacterized protein K437DRAFT_37565 [Tilletiaria anomala UBC 951]KDN37578.1 hypothetical protein K437DRAFT_37565 [Tilletiaria anomala UBC 951]